MEGKILTVTHTPTCGAEIQVGDIYYAKWGTTMDMVDFFKVIHRTAKFVTLRKLKKQDDRDNFYSGRSLPVDEYEDYSNCFDSERFEDTDGKVYAQRRIKIQQTAVLQYDNYTRCYPWDGKPKSYYHLD